MTGVNISEINHLLLRSSRCRIKRNSSGARNVYSEKRVNLEINHKELVWIHEITDKLNLNLNSSH